MDRGSKMGMKKTSIDEIVRGMVKIALLGIALITVCLLMGKLIGGVL